ncbi:lipoprotein-releasing ABC transporter permease subunit [Sphingomonas donggukensis]|uniref:Lipoprotein-releasing ABC transporter permease subunit n=1 Tax=Sphingomonas donggukensis TaxID=2949093 RepID=A0ABY4TX57_9SPHN|nr:lipoprotein-releasing ABC transporter permease subunit [Sphingomonas donggukensis]URW76450.1 lipoprotein-releasing ABC transporter permease subunit [Sphingomonas donggukensis]
MLLSRYERMIARRYLLPGRGEAFIALVAGISLVAVMLGVAALVVVMSVMNGFRAELFDKIVGLNGHVVVQGYGGQLRDWRTVVEQARATPGVVSATPLIEQPLMAGYNGRVEAVLVRGMRVADIRANTTLNSNVVVGSLASLKPYSGRIAIGSRLAQALGATEGSEISLISPQGPASPFGTVPRIVSYTVGAIFEVGVYDYDKAFVVMPMEDAQTLLLMGDSVGMIELDTDDPDRVELVAAPLARKVGERGQVTDWRQMNAQLFEALSVDRLVTFTVLSILIMVSVFNILSSLIMLVRAKTRDIAILRTMGATRGGLMRIFMTVGTAIGAVGIGAGLILGFVLLYFRQGVVSGLGYVTGQQIWDPSMRFLTELPAKTDPLEVAGIAAMAFAFSFLATLYPAFKAANTDPVQVLRYD